MINTQEQIIIEQITYRIGGIYLINTKDRGWIAEIMFEMIQNSNVIGTKVISKTGQEYNTFWDNFNSGRFLIEEFITQNNIQFDIPDTIEEEFINTYE